MQHHSEYFQKFSENFSCLYSENPPSNRPHIHDVFELSFVLSDGVVLDIDNKAVDIPKNSIIILNNMDLHKIHSKPGYVYKRYVFWFEPEFFSYAGQFYIQLLQCFYYRPFSDSHILPLNDQQTENLNGIFSRLCFEAASDNSMHTEITAFIAGTLLAYVNRYYVSYHHITSDIFQQNYLCTYNAINYIHNHLADSLNVSELAKASFVNRRKFIEAFHNITGFTPSQYILKCRLEQSKQLLIQGFSINEVMEKTGFKNLSSFIRSFHKYSGITPKQFSIIYKKLCIKK